MSDDEKPAAFRTERLEGRIIDPKATDWQQPVAPGECPVEQVYRQFPDIEDCGLWQELMASALAYHSGLPWDLARIAVQVASDQTDALRPKGRAAWDAAFRAKLRETVAACRIVHARQSDPDQCQSP